MILRTLVGAAALSVSCFAADLSQVKTVYILSMGNGLDQYLAHRLNDRGRFQIVIDPAAADAVLTDRLGPEFEAKLKELYPPPEVKPEKKDEEEEEDKDALEYKSPPAVRSASFSRGRGNIFLVDRRANRVLWSNYERPRNSRPDELDRVAETVAARLTKAAKTN